jgi:hypothetical protein
MLLAFASLGAGMVSAEDCNEQTVDLEELGILEVSMSDDGVIEALIVKEAFFAFMNADEADLPAIESVAMSVSLGEDGELVLSDFDINVGENQPDEVAVTLRLSDELLDIIHSEDVDLSDLLSEIGMEDVEEADYEEYYGSRLHWADEAYQLRGCQDDYDRVLEADDPQYEYYVIYEEMMHDWEADEPEEESNESSDDDWEAEDSDEDTDEDVEGESGDELDEEFHENPNDEYNEDERDSLDDLIEPRDGEISQIIVIVNTDGEIAEVTIIVIYEDGDYEMNVYTMLLEEVRARLADFDGVVIWNWIPAPPVDPVDDSDEGPDVLRERCARGLLRGTFTIDDDGNGAIRGLVMNANGEVVNHMWGTFDSDGFMHGLAGADNSTDAMWKAVADEGLFQGLWRTTSEDVDPMHGILKGHYEVNDARDGGVYHGKWKEVDCRDDLDLEEMDSLPPVIDTEPRHNPIRVDAERVDDVRQLDKAPKQKPLMDKLGDVMDKPLVEDENGGSIVDVGEAAAGSTLGTIALLGAGFIRRRVTGGI